MKHSNAFLRVFVVLLTGTIFPPSALAATSSISAYSSRVWQMEEGLPHDIVQAITQSADGYLWVGTREGLARFDGVRFTQLDFPGSLRHPSITALHEAEDGTLWIGTDNAGLFQLQHGALTQIAAAGGFASQISGIEETSGGLIWIGTPQGLAQWRDGKIQPAADKKLTEPTMGLCADHKGGVWHVDGQLERVTASGVTTYDNCQGLAHVMRGMGVDHNDILWLGGGRGLLRVKNGVSTLYAKGPGPLGVVDAVFEDREGNLWIGSNGDLSRFVDGKFIDESPKSGTGRVYAIFQDREGSLWVGCEQGLARLRPGLFSSYTVNEGLSQNRIESICAGTDSSIWVGTRGGGVDEFHDGKFTVYAKANGLPSDYIGAMGEGAAGSMWVGMDYSGGLVRVKDGQLTCFGPAQGLATSLVTAVLEERDGTVWLGARAGLTRFRNGKFIHYTLAGGPERNMIRALCQTHDDVLWIGTDSGLVRQIRGAFVSALQNEPEGKRPVRALYEDAAHTLWIGTSGGGLMRLKDGKADTFTSQHGLFSDSIYSIVEDGRSNLWFNSSKGIFRMSKADLEDVARHRLRTAAAISYGRWDGIPACGQRLDSVQAGACKGRDGRLWFRTTLGVVVVDSAQISPNPLPPPVLIEEILAGKDKIFPAPSITIGPGRGELEIRYTALSFRAPEKNNFRYRLEGVDPDWVEAGTRRVAYYNNLPPGRFRFQVIACNDDGVWNETGARMALILEPHFWQTKWFDGLAALAVVGSAAGGARYSTKKKMQRQMELLEQKHALETERARIARDIHDDLGARLVDIFLIGEQIMREDKSLADVKTQTRGVTRKVEQAIHVVDQIVWAVDPENDSLPNLADYLSDYAQDFLQSTRLRCWLDVAAGLPAVALRAQARHDLFLAVKEALNNVVKHAKATQIKLQIHCVADELFIAVEDDGQGFVLARAENRAGSGLGNMRQRMSNLGARTEIISRQGQGTIVRFIVPLSSTVISTHYGQETNAG